MTKNDLEWLRMTRNNLKYDKKVKCDGQTNGRTDGRTNGQMTGRTDSLLEIRTWWTQLRFLKDLKTYSIAAITYFQLYNMSKIVNFNEVCEWMTEEFYMVYCSARHLWYRDYVTYNQMMHIVRIRTKKWEKNKEYWPGKTEPNPCKLVFAVHMTLWPAFLSVDLLVSRSVGWSKTSSITKWLIPVCVCWRSSN